MIFRVVKKRHSWKSMFRMIPCGCRESDRKGSFLTPKNDPFLGRFLTPFWPPLKTLLSNSWGVLVWFSKPLEDYFWPFWTPKWPQNGHFWPFLGRFLTPFLTPSLWPSMGFRGGFDDFRGQKWPSKNDPFLTIFDHFWPFLTLFWPLFVPTFLTLFWLFPGRFTSPFWKVGGIKKGSFLGSFLTHFGSFLTPFVPTFLTLFWLFPGGFTSPFWKVGGIKKGSFWGQKWPLFWSFFDPFLSIFGILSTENSKREVSKNGPKMVIFDQFGTPDFGISRNTSSIRFEILRSQNRRKITFFRSYIEKELNIDARGRTRASFVYILRGSGPGPVFGKPKKKYAIFHGQSGFQRPKKTPCTLLGQKPVLRPPTFENGESNQPESDQKRVKKVGTKKGHPRARA